MKVVEITSRLFMTTNVRIVSRSTYPNGHIAYNCIWEGEPQNMPADLLDRNLYAIEAIAEDLIAIHI